MTSNDIIRVIRWVMPDVGVEDLIDALVAMVAEELAGVGHDPNVTSCLIACMTKLQHASLDYYVSTK